MGVVPFQIVDKSPDEPTLEGEGTVGSIGAGSISPSSTWPLLREKPAGTTTLEAGAELGPYRLLRVLGRGGMGVVYLAHEAPPIQRLAAVKVLRSTAGSRRLRKRLETEVRALARLSHPNIAQVFAAGHTADGSPYFALEYVPGQRIDEYCNQEQLSLEERIELFLQLCRGVRYAHRRGVLHRDLKPSNVLVTEIDGHRLVKIIDFSIAASLVPSDADSATAGVAGTPGYMSPEARRDQTAGADRRSDVYSLGAVLYLLLGGVRPFAIEAGAAESSPRKPLREVPSPPSQRVAELPLVARETLADKRGQTSPRELAQRLRGDLDAIVLRAMNPVRSGRYASVQELIDDLQHHLANEPVHARPMSWGYRTSCFARRNRRQVAASLIAAVGLTAFAAFALHHHRLGHSVQRIESEVSAERRASELLEQLLAGGDPAGAPLSSTILQDAQRRARELSDEPVAQARLFQLLGRAYQSRGDYAAATGLLESALQIQERELGASSLAVADTAADLCGVYGAQAASSRAVEACRYSLELRRARLGDEAPAVADALERLALVLEEGGAPEEAGALFQRALDVRRRHGDTMPDALVDSLLADAAFHRRRARPEEAQQLLEQALALRVAASGSEHAATVPIREELASVLAERGHLEDARLEYLHCLQVLDRSGVTRQAPRGRIFQHLAELDLLTHRLQDAERNASRALELLGEELAPTHPSLAEAEVLLGRIELESGDIEAADARIGRALEMYEAAYGPHPPEAAAARIAAGDVAAARGLLTAARERYESSLASLRQLDPDGLDTARAMTRLGTVLHRQGSLPEALHLQQEALAILERLPGLAQLDTAAVLNELGRLSAERGDLAEARRFLERALMLRTALVDASDPEVATLRGELVALAAGAQRATS